MPPAASLNRCYTVWMRGWLLGWIVCWAAALGAPSYPYGLFRGAVTPVSNGQYLYVELDPRHDVRNGGSGLWMGPTGIYDAPVEWTESGLYRTDEPTKAIWTGDLNCRFAAELFVSRDGMTATVFRDGARPILSTFREGQLVGTWSFPDARQLHDSTAFSEQHRFETSLVDQQIRLIGRDRREYYFSLNTGAYLGQSRSVPRPWRVGALATDEELAAFELALAGGEDDDLAPDEGSAPARRDDEWVGEVPAGSEIFTSGDGRIRVVRLAEGSPGGPSTSAYLADGSELWSVSEALPRPVFLGDLAPSSELDSVQVPESGVFPLVVSGDGTCWALLSYDSKTRSASIKSFNGTIKVQAAAQTYEGPLKFGSVHLTGVDRQRINVTLKYGLDWSEAYELELSTAILSHTVNFPPTTEEDVTTGHYPYPDTWTTLWVPVILVALILMIVGFLIGRVSKRT